VNGTAISSASLERHGLHAQAVVRSNPVLEHVEGPIFEEDFALRNLVVVPGHLLQEGKRSGRVRAIEASPNRMDAPGSVRALLEVLPLAAPAVQQRAAEALMGLGEVLEQGAAHEAALLRIPTGGAAGRDTTGKAGIGNGRRSTCLGLGLGGGAALLLGLLAHRHSGQRRQRQKNDEADNMTKNENFEQTPKSEKKFGSSRLKVT